MRRVRRKGAQVAEAPRDAPQRARDGARLHVRDDVSQYVIGELLVHPRSASPFSLCFHPRGWRDFDLERISRAQLRTRDHARAEKTFDVPH